jgi:transposase
MPIVGGLDIHRKQITFDYLDTGTGQVRRGQVSPADRVHLRAGEGRFSSSRKAVRFAGLDVTVYSSDRKGPPGRLSRQGPPVLRWAVYEAGKTHARAPAPDHAYYAQVKDRCNGKRAALSEARKILRQACHILAELGDDALAAV